MARISPSLTRAGIFANRWWLGLTPGQNVAEEPGAAAIFRVLKLDQKSVRVGEGG